MSKDCYRKEDYKRADVLCKTDPRFGGPGSVTHDYPGALEAAKRERWNNTPLARRLRKEWRNY